MKKILHFAAWLLFACSVQLMAQNSSVFPKGNVATVDNHTGTVWLAELSKSDDVFEFGVAQATFAAGAKLDWHIHPGGQILMITEGTGYYQEKDKPVQIVHKGDVIKCTPGVAHWHGATPDSTFAYIAISPSQKGGTKWLQRVTDEEYRGKTTSDLHRNSKPVEATREITKPSAAQKLFGDFDPKLAELTDGVLFADVWERPELSKRDRSLITVAVLITQNRPEQLRSHLQRARENGVTKSEVVEVITHLAFYTGWPNAVNAIQTAREVF